MNTPDPATSEKAASISDPLADYLFADCESGLTQQQVLRVVKLLDEWCRDWIRPRFPVPPAPADGSGKGRIIVDDRENPSRLAAVLRVEILYLGADVVLRLVASELRSVAMGQSQHDAMIRNAERIELAANEIEIGSKAVPASLAELKEQLAEAQGQVKTLLTSKAAAERDRNAAQHDLNAVIGVVSAHMASLERIGVKLPPPGPNVKTNAVIVMNAAVDAADGKEYMPYERERDCRRFERELAEAKAKLTAAETALAEVKGQLAAMREERDSAQRIQHATAIDVLNISVKLTAAQSRIRELEAMQNQQQPEPRCGFCGTKLTLVRPGSHQCDNPECESNQ